MLFRSLERLPDAERRAIQARYFDGLTRREGAELLNTTPTQFKTREDNALRKLRHRRTLKHYKEIKPAAAAFNHVTLADFKVNHTSGPERALLHKQQKATR